LQPSSDGVVKRIGLDRDRRARLLEVIDPQFPHNAVRRTTSFRNYMAAGEVLALRLD
jgi:hypothetical protein